MISRFARRPTAAAQAHPRTPLRAPALDVIIRCLPDLTAAQDDLVFAVHARLLEALPAAASLPGSGRPLCRRMVAALLQSERGLPSAAILFRVAGAAHCADGLPESGVATLMPVLLRAIEVVLQPVWNRQLRSAWTEYLTWLGAEQAEGYRLASFQQAARLAQANHDARRPAASLPVSGHAWPRPTPPPSPAGPAARLLPDR